METQLSKTSAVPQSDPSPFSAPAPTPRKTSKLKLVMGGIALLVAGVVIGKQLPAGKEDVREALYRACVQGGSYKPEASTVADGFSCSRRSIDLAIATIYGDSYMDPIDGLTRAKYEKAMDKYKK